MSRIVVALVLLLFITMGAASDEVSYERIRASASEPANWLTYSGNYAGHRYSSLARINKSNVGQLKPTWAYQMQDRARVETSPIVVDGTLYITEWPYVVTALDGRTGRPLWTYRRKPSKAIGCCGVVNRGLAILDDALYFVTFDAQLIALDRRTGTVRWERQLADYRQGYSSTGAPLALKDKIVVGIAGGELGIRGFLDAYDPRTGAQLWRFWTVPGPGEPGHETWKGDSWKTGGAPTWVTGSYDPELNLLYWGTGNPSPDWNGDVREGENLYSDCLLALDPDTGKLRWYFQFTPHDEHDYDATQVPVLVDRVVNGRLRKLVITANRNGFYYVLDRQTGEFMSGTSFVKQTWAIGLDAHGRPIPRPEAEPSAKGELVYPGTYGGTNWMSPSFSPITGLFYVSSFENYGQVFFKKTSVSYRPGHFFTGGVAIEVPGVESEGVIKALDAKTGRVKWEFKLQTRSFAGALATAGGLVFSGAADGNFFALDGETGEALWHFQTGGEVAANPVSFLVDGKQHVAIAGGSALFDFVVE